MSDTPRTDAIMRLHNECKAKLATPANEYVLRVAVEKLERELAAVRELLNVYNLGGWTDAVAPMKRALQAEAERDALRADAERYRWLRHGRPRTTGSPRPGRIEVVQWEDRSEGNVLKGDDLDAAIDRERK